MRPSRIGVVKSVWEMKKRSRYSCGLKFSPRWNEKKWKCWYLFRIWPLTRCNGVRASEFWKRRYRWHKVCEKLYSSILWQHEICHQIQLDEGDEWWQATLFPRVYEFSSFSENSIFDSWSRTNNQSLKSSCCENSWREWMRSCESNNLQTRRHNVRSDFKRDWARCERNSRSQGRLQEQRSSTTFQNQKKWALTKEGNHSPLGNFGSSWYEGKSCMLSLPCSKQGIPIHKENHSHEWRHGKPSMPTSDREDIWQRQVPKAVTTILFDRDERHWWFT